MATMIMVDIVHKNVAMAPPKTEKDNGVSTLRVQQNTPQGYSSSSCSPLSWSSRLPPGTCQNITFLEKIL